MRVLFVSPRQCWPPTSGAKLREYYFARALGRHTAVTYVFYADPAGPPVGAAELPFCEKIVPVPAPRRYTPAKILKGLAGRWPLPAVNYTSPGMQEALAHILGGASFDLAHIDYVNMAPYATLLRLGGAARQVYDWHNIESELMRRYSRGAAAPPRKLYAAWTARRLEGLEKRVLREALGHVVCSARERDILLRAAPGARVEVVENGVDTAFFDQPVPAAQERNCLVFVGLMSYHANIEAAVGFVRSVWPEIRERFPAWKLILVGANPAPAVTALAAEKNVEVTGTVDDVRPYYQRALAAIVPLRTGGGTRLKILEAMAAGVPVISTTLGAEGLAAAPGRDLLIADSQPEWIERLTALAREPRLWRALTDSGRDLVRARYDWSMLGETLYETYLGWLKST
jgi:sugar transferase (PEP-CTERM/EpsH1 system associated)